jgi:hypothetical protein
MLSLSQKIESIYPQLKTRADWEGIVLENSGSGDYIKTWDHSTLTQPTEAELDAVDESAYLARKARAKAERNRAAAYAAESDPLFFKAQRGEATTDEWTAKVAEIKARFPYPAEGGAS